MARSSTSPTITAPTIAFFPRPCEKRDLYVYLPPGYTPDKKYPLGIFLHGNSQDEQFFITKPVQLFDEAIACGKLPPVIVVAPDGSIPGPAVVL